MNLLNKTLLASVVAAGTLLLTPAYAQESNIDPAAEQHQADTLDQLLDMVRSKTLQDRSELQQREAEFAQARDDQAKLLAQAKARRDAAEARSKTLEQNFDSNKLTIKEKEEQLNNKLGALKELFGIFQQTAGDLQGIFHNSPVSAQYPGRNDFLEAFAKKMSRASQISTIDEIEQLWFELQREMTEGGKIATFEAPVLTAEGREVTKKVVRVGEFDVVTNDPDPRYLAWRGDQQTLAELKRQPDGRYLSMIDDYVDSREPAESFGLDPTGGSLLARLVEAPRLNDRIQQGGTVGYVIIALGAVALLVALERIIMLTIVAAKVRRQKAQVEAPSNANPLGRVLNAYHANQGVDAETLEMKLGEAILKETPSINRALTFLKIVSVAAPLLGLLGTVTGMINTFQAITLFGTGDPKTMAGGISQALVTTVEGLCVAIPVVFLHSAASSRAKAIIHMLHEQSAGLIAEYM
ncbi:DUF3450 family protein, partial [Sinimarinibacterium sp. CAU 1509]